MLAHQINRSCSLRSATTQLSRRLPRAGGASLRPARGSRPCLSLWTSTWPVRAALCLLAPAFQCFAAPRPDLNGLCPLRRGIHLTQPGSIPGQCSEAVCIPTVTRTLFYDAATTLQDVPVSKSNRLEDTCPHMAQEGRNSPSGPSH